MTLRSFFKRLERSRRKSRYQDQAVAFENACKALSEQDIAIDCGANVGIYTKMMADSGAQVYAFEPNPVAYEALKKNTQGYSNVKLFNAATTVDPGSVKLYMHKKAQHDPLLYSVSSSILAAKSNVDSGFYEEVEAVVLADFIEGLNGPVKLLKMDVEGAEVALLNHLIDRGLHSVIKQGFVEVHDRRIANLRKPTQALRERLAEEGASHITLDWR